MKRVRFVDKYDLNRWSLGAFMRGDYVGTKFFMVSFNPLPNSRMLPTYGCTGRNLASIEVLKGILGHFDCRGSTSNMADFCEVI